MMTKPTENGVDEEKFNHPVDLQPFSKTCGREARCSDDEGVR